jgi:hypothetical protein
MFKWLTSLFGKAEQVVDDSWKEIKSTINNEVTTPTKRAYDNTKLTKTQLRHLVNVYERKLEGVATYADLAQYANEKYNMNKKENSIYTLISKYKKSLES